MYTAASSRARRGPFAEPVGDEQAEVERDLIVAAAARVELLAHVAHEFGEAAFDVHVNVFQFFFPLEGAVLDFRAHGGEAGDELIGLLALMTPCRASIRAWAHEPAISCLYRAQS